MAQAGTRLSLYLPVRMMRDFQPNSRKISERGVELLDRMIEALRRTPVELRFNPDEIALMGEVCGAWGLQPAAAVFGGLARDLRWQDRGSPDLLEKLATLTPFEEIALIEYLERGLVVAARRKKERLAAEPVDTNGGPRPEAQPRTGR